MTKEYEEMRETIAEFAHLTWQRWMGYMLTHLDTEHIERWTRQANTPYQDLPGDEKLSDKVIADKYLSMRTDTCRIAVVKTKEELPKNPYSRQPDPTDYREVGWMAYTESQRDMLQAGFVQEERGNE